MNSKTRVLGCLLIVVFSIVYSCNGRSTAGENAPSNITKKQIAEIEAGLSETTPDSEYRFSNNVTIPLQKSVGFRKEETPTGPRLVAFENDVLEVPAWGRIYIQEYRGWPKSEFFQMSAVAYGGDGIPISESETFGISERTLVAEEGKALVWICGTQILILNPDLKRVALIVGTPESGLFVSSELTPDQRYFWLISRATIKGPDQPNQFVPVSNLTFYSLQGIEVRTEQLRTGGEQTVEIDGSTYTVDVPEPEMPG